jgi:prenylcysteine oxidase/farnesylcysteine lyase
MVCMAIEGAMQIEGGNWQIFAGMLNASDAKVRLNTTVTSIQKTKGNYRVTSKPTAVISGDSVGTEESYDTVVLAAPLQFSEIEIEKKLLRYYPDSIPYVTLHVTLFTSTYPLNGTYFNLAPGAEVPTTILTTLSPDEKLPNPEKGVGSSGFFSISTLRTLVNPKTLQKEYLYKIFSPETITPEFLSGILGAESTTPIYLNILS